MAAVVFNSTAVGGYGTECTLREGGGGIQLAVAGEGKGVAREQNTRLNSKHAGGGGGEDRASTQYIQLAIQLDFTPF